MRIYFFLILISISLLPEAHAFIRGPVTIHVDNATSPERRWRDLGKSDEDRVRFLIETLMTSKTGRSLLQKARDRSATQGKTIFDVVLPGDISITDTTLTRRFSPEKPEAMAFELHSKVFINRDLKVRDALLDLAHELVHFIYKSPFNPYQEEFLIKDFIVSTLEGRGGEIDAFMAECMVEKELFPSRSRESSNCNLVVDEDGQLSRTKTVQEFYKVGPYLKMVQEDLSRFKLNVDNFEVLNGDQANFISSAYGVPYPLAALREFETIMSKVCENDYKRLTYMKESMGQNIGRALSSILTHEKVDTTVSSSSGLEKVPTTGRRGQEFLKMAQSYQRRCEFFPHDKE